MMKRKKQTSREKLVIAKNSVAIARSKD